MAAANSTPTPSPSPAGETPAEDEAAKALQKRYDGLCAVRDKAIKGKGAWYWVHLEPVLVRNSDTCLPKAVKLRCSLCDATFSASNPSRTASEHLKRGTCANFASPPPTSSSAPANFARPISSFPPARKRPPPTSSTSTSYLHPPLALDFPASHQLVLSGGKDDLAPLALLEDRVKKLKSPKASPGTALSKAQSESAFALLADWVYESSGAVSFSSFEHPKFQAFLHQVGLRPVPRNDLLGSRLDARFDTFWSEAEARIRDAMFFQVASDGWKPHPNAAALLPTDDRMVTVTVNLPNGTSVFRKAVFTAGDAPSDYAEEILWETITGVCGGMLQRCAGIVADKFKGKALRDLESRNQWMVNLSCQLQAFNRLLKDFSCKLPLFRSVAADCAKLVRFFNTRPEARNAFRKYQIQEFDNAGLLRCASVVPPTAGRCGSNSVKEAKGDFLAVFAMMDDVFASGPALHSAVRDESYRIVTSNDPIAREVEEKVQDMAFWRDLEAVHSLVKLVRSMAHEMEVERPLVGQCLPLWNELRSKVKEWCAKSKVDAELVDKVIDNRFRKNYHPAWSAAFILDPFYLMRDTSGKYLPPFKFLTPEQEKDVDKLITRLVLPDEAPVALMELMKWRSEGLDALYAQAVQMKQRDPITGKERIANPQSSRLVWETYLSEFKVLRRVAVRLIFLQATACGFKCNLSFLRWVGGQRRSNAGMDRAQKLLFVAANAKLERRDFSSEEERDLELFANGDEDVNDLVITEARSV